MKSISKKIKQIFPIIVLIIIALCYQTVHADTALIVSTDKDIYNYGETIKVNFSNAPGNWRDWICIVPESSPDNEAGNYKNIPKKSNGTLTFIAPLPGKYEVRAYYNYDRNGYVVTARSSFSVVYYAFRNLAWGTDISNLKDMQYVGTDQSYGGVKNYVRKGDELKIGGAQLESIIYGFWQGKFSSVTINVEGYVNFTALKDATIIKYGVGDKPNQFMERYVWGAGTISTILIDYNEISKKGTLFMSSIEINKQQKLYDIKNATEGAIIGF